MANLLTLATLAFATFAYVSPQYDYTPDWDSLDARPLPAWFDQGKIGIFIHWGIYCVPGFGGEWFWWAWKQDGNENERNFMERNYKPGFTYQEFAEQLTAEFYNPADWANLFRRSGAKYVVLTSKHHEGYTLWPSSYHFAWNSMEVGSHRDLLGELANATRAEGLRFGAYYSLLEWFSEWHREWQSGYVTNRFPRERSMPALRELVERYQPEILWSDGNWGPADTYWESTQFLAWLYNESPVRDTVVVNDRWGDGTAGKHGGFYNYDDRHNPGVVQPHKWENAMSILRGAWGHRRNSRVEDYFYPEELVRTLVETVACGGNFLMNVGPNQYGMIDPIYQERLLQMGQWLEVNGDAIYDTEPWTVQNDTMSSGIWYTQNHAGTQIYAMITLGWPGTQVTLGSVGAGLGIARIEMLGTPDTALNWFPAGDAGITVTLPPLHINRSQWAWTLAISLAAA